jgi:hypothetical protein
MKTTPALGVSGLPNKQGVPEEFAPGAMSNRQKQEIAKFSEIACAELGK